MTAQSMTGLFTIEKAELLMSRKIWRRLLVVASVIIISPAILWWWTGPSFDPNLFSVSELNLDGIAMNDAILTLAPGRTYTLTCTLRTNGVPFLAAKPGDSIETKFLLNQSACERATSERKQIPAFVVAFTQSWRAGRSLPGVTQFAEVTRIDESGMTAELRAVCRAPTEPGKYSLKFEFVSCKIVNWGRNGSFGFGSGTIVWSKTASVRAEKK